VIVGFFLQQRLKDYTVSSEVCFKNLTFIYESKQSISQY